MTYTGVAKGKMIELEEDLPFQNGERVSVFVESLRNEPRRGSSSAVLRAMAAPPHLQSESVDELLRAINAGKLPVQSTGVFEQ
ncbi:MAG: hypothetical protein HY360_14465 [Verrucomicrobia bacterium]|nr:hypothetical protein [Verrucomicrobiota bacterium]